MKHSKESAVFEVTFCDRRKFKVFCHGNNQHKIFRELILDSIKEIDSVTIITQGIHNMLEFNKIINSNKSKDNGK